MFHRATLLVYFSDTTIASVNYFGNGAWQIRYPTGAHRTCDLSVIGTYVRNSCIVLLARGNILEFRGKIKKFVASNWF